MQSSELVRCRSLGLKSSSGYVTTAQGIELRFRLATECQPGVPSQGVFWDGATTMPVFQRHERVVPSHSDSDKFALIRAIRRNQTRVVLALLERGASPNVTDHEGSALIHAIRRNQKTVVLELLKRGAIPSPSGDTRRR